MKRLLLFTLLFLGLSTAFAQRIHFGNSSNVWSLVDSTTACCIPNPMHYTSAQYEDSLVYNGHFYRYLSGTVASFLIREDSNRVYVIGTADSIERILYDFNLGLNDTFRLIYPEDTFTTWVTTLDSTQIAGNWYKVWHFDGQDASTYYPDSFRHIWYNVIEGIGCTNGPYYPASPYMLANFSQMLLCFSNDIGGGSLSVPVNAYGCSYTQLFDNSASCDTFSNHHHIIVDNTGVKDIAENTAGARVVPNPILTLGKIVFPFSVSGTLTVVNVQGQEVLRTVLANEAEATVTETIATPGLYYYKVTDIKTGTIFSGKFIRQ